MEAATAPIRPDGGERAHPRLRVLALAPYPDGAPSTRYRVLQMLPTLAALGVDVRFHPFVSEETYGRHREGSGPAMIGALVDGMAALRVVLQDSQAFDAIWIQRGLAPVLNGALLRELRFGDVPLVYDFDDAVHLPQEHGRWWLEALRRPRASTVAFCRAARVVLAGNAHLARFAIETLGPTGASRVRVVPSAVDTERFRPRGEPRSLTALEPPALPTLGWIGSSTTLRYLEALAPALRALAESVPHRLVVVAGPRPPKLPGVAVEHRVWSGEREAELVQELDVGLYPLEDSPWTLGKCGFKALQYLACGVPCVASPVGVLRDIVRPGETGLHARGEGEWIDACARLLGDAAERKRMGENGRRLVERGYSVDVVAQHIAGVLREAAAGGGRSGGSARNA